MVACGSGDQRASWVTTGHRMAWVTGIRSSLRSSVGSIVFGMEDGVVSIFGLVFGVSTAAPNSHAVWLAGATGAVAAAISMMAGTYLDVESTNDQATNQLAEQHARFDMDNEQFKEAIRGHLIAAGFGDGEATTVIDIFSNHPDEMVKIDSAVSLGIGEATRRNPIVESIWMFLTDLFAAAVPVLPFAFLGLGTARIVSLIVTGALLIFLGLGRSRVGRRALVPTVLETIGIAAV